MKNFGKNLLSQMLLQQQLQDAPTNFTAPPPDPVPFAPLLDEYEGADYPEKYKTLIKKATEFVKYFNETYKPFNFTNLENRSSDFQKLITDLHRLTDYRLRIEYVNDIAGCYSEGIGGIESGDNSENIIAIDKLLLESGRLAAPITRLSNLETILSRCPQNFTKKYSGFLHKAQGRSLKLSSDVDLISVLDTKATEELCHYERSKAPTDLGEELTEEEKNIQEDFDISTLTKSKNSDEKTLGEKLLKIISGRNSGDEEKIKLELSNYKKEYILRDLGNNITEKEKGIYDEIMKYYNVEFLSRSPDNKIRTFGAKLKKNIQTRQAKDKIAGLQASLTKLKTEAKVSGMSLEEYIARNTRYDPSVLEPTIDAYKTNPPIIYTEEMQRMLGLRNEYKNVNAYIYPFNNYQLSGDFYNNIRGFYNNLLAQYLPDKYKNIFDNINKHRFPAQKNATIPHYKYLSENGEIREFPTIILEDNLDQPKIDPARTIAHETNGHYLDRTAKGLEGWGTSLDYLFYDVSGNEILPAFMESMLLYEAVRKGEIDERIYSQFMARISYFTLKLYSTHVSFQKDLVEHFNKHNSIDEEKIIEFNEKHYLPLFGGNIDDFSKYYGVAQSIRNSNFIFSSAAYTSNPIGYYFFSEWKKLGTDDEKKEFMKKYMEFSLSEDPLETRLKNIFDITLQNAMSKGLAEVQELTKNTVKFAEEDFKKLEELYKTIRSLQADNIYDERLTQARKAFFEYIEKNNLQTYKVAIKKLTDQTLREAFQKEYQVVSETLENNLGVNKYLDNPPPTTIEEKIVEHCEKHNIAAYESAREHDLAHTVLELNGAAESNITFRSEEMAAIMQLVLFNKIHYSVNGYTYCCAASNTEMPDSAPEFEKVWSELQNNFKLNFTLTVYRQLRELELIKDDYIGKNPDKSKEYSDAQLEVKFDAFKKINPEKYDDFLEYKIDRLRILEAKHADLSNETNKKIADLKNQEYDGSLTKKEAKVIYETAVKIRERLVKKNIRLHQIENYEVIADLDYRLFVNGALNEKGLGTELSSLGVTPTSSSNPIDPSTHHHGKQNMRPNMYGSDALNVTSGSGTQTPITQTEEWKASRAALTEVQKKAVDEQLKTAVTDKNLNEVRDLIVNQYADPVAAFLRAINIKNWDALSLVIDLGAVVPEEEESTKIQVKAYLDSALLKYGNTDNQTKETFKDIKILLKAGANPNATDSKTVLGKVTYHYGIIAHQIALELIKYGAKVDDYVVNQVDFENAIDLIEKSGGSVKDFSKKLMLKVINSGNIKQLEKLVKEGVDIPNLKFEDEWEKELIPKAEKVFSRNWGSSDERNHRKGISWRDYVKFIERLIDLGANLNYKWDKDNTYRVFSDLNQFLYEHHNHSIIEKIYLNEKLDPGARKEGLFYLELYFNNKYRTTILSEGTRNSDNKKAVFNEDNGVLEFTPKFDNDGAKETIAYLHVVSRLQPLKEVLSLNSSEIRSFIDDSGGLSNNKADWIKLHNDQELDKKIANYLSDKLTSIRINFTIHDDDSNRYLSALILLAKGKKYEHITQLINTNKANYVKDVIKNLYKYFYNEPEIVEELIKHGIPIRDYNFIDWSNKNLRSVLSQNLFTETELSDNTANFEELNTRQKKIVSHEYTTETLIKLMSGPLKSIKTIREFNSYIKTWPQTITNSGANYSNLIKNINISLVNDPTGEVYKNFINQYFPQIPDLKSVPLPCELKKKAYAKIKLNINNVEVPLLFPVVAKTRDSSILSAANRNLLDSSGRSLLNYLIENNVKVAGLGGFDANIGKDNLELLADPNIDLSNNRGLFYNILANQSLSREHLQSAEENTLKYLNKISGAEVRKGYIKSLVDALPNEMKFDTSNKRLYADFLANFVFAYEFYSNGIGKVENYKIFEKVKTLLTDLSKNEFSRWAENLGQLKIFEKVITGLEARLSSSFTLNLNSYYSQKLVENTYIAFKSNWRSAEDFYDENSERIRSLKDAIDEITWKLVMPAFQSTEEERKKLDTLSKDQIEKLVESFRSKILKMYIDNGYTLGDILEISDGIHKKGSTVDGLLRTVERTYGKWHTLSGDNPIQDTENGYTILEVPDSEKLRRVSDLEVGGLCSFRSYLERYKAGTEHNFVFYNKEGDGRMSLIINVKKDLDEEYYKKNRYNSGSRQISGKYIKVGNTNYYLYIHELTGKGDKKNFSEEEIKSLSWFVSQVESGAIKLQFKNLGLIEPENKEKTTTSQWVLERIGFPNVEKIKITKNPKSDPLYGERNNWERAFAVFSDASKTVIEVGNQDPEKPEKGDVRNLNDTSPATGKYVPLETKKKTVSFVENVEGRVVVTEVEMGNNILKLPGLSGLPSIVHPDKKPVIPPTLRNPKNPEEFLEKSGLGAAIKEKKAELGFPTTKNKAPNPFDTTTERATGDLPAIIVETIDPLSGEKAIKTINPENNVEGDYAKYVREMLKHIDDAAFNPNGEGHPEIKFAEEGVLSAEVIEQYRNTARSRFVLSSIVLTDWEHRYLESIKRNIDKIESYNFDKKGNLNINFNISGEKPVRLTNLSASDALKAAFIALMNQNNINELKGYTRDLKNNYVFILNEYFSDYERFKDEQKAAALKNFKDVIRAINKNYPKMLTDTGKGSLFSGILHYGNKITETYLEALKEDGVDTGKHEKLYSETLPNNTIKIIFAAKTLGTTITSYNIFQGADKAWKLTVNWEETKNDKIISISNTYEIGSGNINDIKSYMSRFGVALEMPSKVVEEYLSDANTKHINSYGIVDIKNEGFKLVLHLKDKKDPSQRSQISYLISPSQIDSIDSYMSNNSIPKSGMEPEVNNSSSVPPVPPVDGNADLPEELKTIDFLTRQLSYESYLGSGSEHDVFKIKIGENYYKLSINSLFGIPDLTLLQNKRNITKELVEERIVTLKKTLSEITEKNLRKFKIVSSAPPYNAGEPILVFEQDGKLILSVGQYVEGVSLEKYLEAHGTLANLSQTSFDDFVLKLVSLEEKGKWFDDINLGNIIYNVADQSLTPIELVDIGVEKFFPEGQIIAFCPKLENLIKLFTSKERKFGGDYTNINTIIDKLTKALKKQGSNLYFKDLTTEPTILKFAGLTEYEVNLIISPFKKAQINKTSPQYQASESVLHDSNFQIYGKWLDAKSSIINILNEFKAPATLEPPIPPVPPVTTPVVSSVPSAPLPMPPVEMSALRIALEEKIITITSQTGKGVIILSDYPDILENSFLLVGYKKYIANNGSFEKMLEEKYNNTKKINTLEEYIKSESDQMERKLLSYFIDLEKVVNDPVYKQEAIERIEKKIKLLSYEDDISDGDKDKFEKIASDPEQYLNELVEKNITSEDRQNIASARQKILDHIDNELKYAPEFYRNWYELGIFTFEIHELKGKLKVGFDYAEGSSSPDGYLQLSDYENNYARDHEVGHKIDQKLHNQAGGTFYSENSSEFERALADDLLLIENRFKNFKSESEEELLTKKHFSLIELIEKYTGLNEGDRIAEAFAHIFATYLRLYAIKAKSTGNNEAECTSFALAQLKIDYPNMARVFEETILPKCKEYASRENLTIIKQSNTSKNDNNYLDNKIRAETKGVPDNTTTSEPSEVTTITPPPVPPVPPVEGGGVELVGGGDEGVYKKLVEMYVGVKGEALGRSLGGGLEGAEGRWSWHYRWKYNEDYKGFAYNHKDEPQDKILVEFEKSEYTGKNVIEYLRGLEGENPEILSSVDEGSLFRRVVDSDDVEMLRAYLDDLRRAHPGFDLSKHLEVICDKATQLRGNGAVFSNPDANKLYYVLYENAVPELQNKFLGVSAESEIGEEVAAESREVIDKLENPLKYIKQPKLTIDEKIQRIDAAIERGKDIEGFDVKSWKEASDQEKRDFVEAIEKLTATEPTSEIKEEDAKAIDTLARIIANEMDYAADLPADMPNRNVIAGIRKLQEIKGNIEWNNLDDGTKKVWVEANNDERDRTARDGWEAEYDERPQREYNQRYGNVLKWAGVESIGWFSSMMLVDAFRAESEAIGAEERGFGEAGKVWKANARHGLYTGLGMLGAERAITGALVRSGNMEAALLHDIYAKYFHYYIQASMVEGGARHQIALFNDNASSFEHAWGAGVDLAYLGMIGRFGVSTGMGLTDPFVGIIQEILINEGLLLPEHRKGSVAWGVLGNIFPNDARPDPNLFKVENNSTYLENPPLVVAGKTEEERFYNILNNPAIYRDEYQTLPNEAVRLISSVTSPFGVSYLWRWADAGLAKRMSDVARDIKGDEFVIDRQLDNVKVKFDPMVVLDRSGREYKTTVVNLTPEDKDILDARDIVAKNTAARKYVDDVEVQFTDDNPSTRVVIAGSSSGAKSASDRKLLNLMKNHYLVMVNARADLLKRFGAENLSEFTGIDIVEIGEEKDGASIVTFVLHKRNADPKKPVLINEENPAAVTFKMKLSNYNHTLGFETDDKGNKTHPNVYTYNTLQEMASVLNEGIKQSGYSNGKIEVKDSGIKIDEKGQFTQQGYFTNEAPSIDVAKLGSGFGDYEHSYKNNYADQNYTTEATGNYRSKIWNKKTQKDIDNPKKQNIGVINLSLRGDKWLWKDDEGREHSDTAPNQYVKYHEDKISGLPDSKDVEIIYNSDGLLFWPAGRVDIKGLPKDAVVTIGELPINKNKLGFVVKVKTGKSEENIYLYGTPEYGISDIKKNIESYKGSNSNVTTKVDLSGWAEKEQEAIKAALIKDKKQREKAKKEQEKFARENSEFFAEVDKFRPSSFELAIKEEVKIIARVNEVLSEGNLINGNEFALDIENIRKAAIADRDKLAEYKNKLIALQKKQKELLEGNPYYAPVRENNIKILGDAITAVGLFEDQFWPSDRSESPVVSALKELAEEAKKSNEVRATVTATEKSISDIEGLGATGVKTYLDNYADLASLKTNIETLTSVQGELKELKELYDKKDSSSRYQELLEKYNITPPLDIDKTIDKYLCLVEDKIENTQKNISLVEKEIDEFNKYPEYQELVEKQKSLIEQLNSLNKEEKLNDKQIKETQEKLEVEQNKLLAEKEAIEKIQKDLLENKQKVEDLLKQNTGEINFARLLGNLDDIEHLLENVNARIIAINLDITKDAEIISQTQEQLEKSRYLEIPNSKGGKTFIYINGEGIIQQGSKAIDKDGEIYWQPTDGKEYQLFYFDEDGEKSPVQDLREFQDHDFDNQGKKEGLRPATQKLYNDGEQKTDRKGQPKFQIYQKISATDSPTNQTDSYASVNVVDFNPSTLPTVQIATLATSMQDITLPNITTTQNDNQSDGMQYASQTFANSGVISQESFTSNNTPTNPNLNNINLNKIIKGFSGVTNSASPTTNDATMGEAISGLAQQQTTLTDKYSSVFAAVKNPNRNVDEDYRKYLLAVTNQSDGIIPASVRENINKNITLSFNILNQYANNATVQEGSNTAGTAITNIVRAIELADITEEQKSQLRENPQIINLMLSLSKIGYAFEKAQTNIAKLHAEESNSRLGIPGLILSSDNENKTVQTTPKTPEKIQQEIEQFYENFLTTNIQNAYTSTTTPKPTQQQPQRF